MSSAHEGDPPGSPPEREVAPLVTRHVGTAAELLAIDPPRTSPSVRIMEVTRPAFVLGSTTPGDIVSGAAAAAGIDVVRRRSGGGVVFVSPGAQAWIDVTLPAENPLWSADVTRSMIWAGNAVAGVVAANWERAVDRPQLRVASSSSGAHRWGLVCFAAIGHGEVVAVPPTVDPEVADPHLMVKLAGLSQRRNRDGAVIQLSVPLRWDPSEWRRFLDLGAAGAEIDWRLRQSVAAAPWATGVDPAESLANAMADHISPGGRR